VESSRYSEMNLLPRTLAQYLSSNMPPLAQLDAIGMGDIALRRSLDQSSGRD
jgi:hypothetical protein